MATSPLLSKFRKKQGDTTDPQKAETVVNFGRNLATLRGSNQGSRNIARPMVGGRHAQTESILTGYATAGKKVTPALQKKLDELDNLAANAQIASEMDDKVRIQLIGAGSKSLDKANIDAHEKRLITELGDLTRDVLTEGLQIERQTKRANLTLKEQTIRSNAITIENAEREQTYNNLVQEFTVPELEDYVENGEYRDDGIPTTWILKRLGERQTQSVSLSNTRNSVIASRLNLDQSIANTSNADLQSTSLADFALASGNPEMLSEELDRINAENAELVANGEEPVLSHNLSHLGFGEIEFGVNVLASANQKLADKFAKANQRDGKDAKTAKEKQAQLQDLQARQQLVTGFQNQSTALLIGLQTADRAFLGNNGLTTRIQELVSTVNTMGNNSKDVDSLHTDIQAAKKELQAIQTQAIDLLPEGSRKAFEEIMIYGTVTTKANGVSHLETAQNINDISANLTNTPMREVHGILEALVNKEAANKETRGVGASVNGVEDKSSPLTRVANDPISRRQMGQALMGSMLDKAVGFGLRNIKAKALQSHPVRQGAGGEITPETIANMAIHEELDTFINDVLTSEGQIRGDKYTALIDYEAKFQTVDDDGEIVNFEDINGDEISVRQILPNQLFELMTLQSTALNELGLDIDIMQEIFNSKDLISSAVADSLTPKNITEQSLVTLMMDDFKGAGAIDSWASQMQQSTQASLVSLENEYYQSREQRQIALDDTLIENAVKAGVTNGEVYKEALANYYRDQQKLFKEALVDENLSGFENTTNPRFKELEEKFDINGTQDLSPKELLSKRRSDGSPYITQEAIFQDSFDKTGGVQ